MKKDCLLPLFLPPFSLFFERGGVAERGTRREAFGRLGRS